MLSAGSQAEGKSIFGFGQGVLVLTAFRRPRISNTVPAIPSKIIKARLRKRLGRPTLPIKWPATSRVGEAFGFIGILPPCKIPSCILETSDAQFL
jgi:hypothetical protein